MNDNLEAADGVVPAKPYQLEADDIFMMEFINITLKNRRPIIIFSLLVSFLLVSYILLQPRTYTAFTSFIPQVGSGQQSLTSSIAAQFGVSIPLIDKGGQSLAFYADLIQSREVTRQLVDSTYTFFSGEERVSATLSVLLKIREKIPALEREKAILKTEDLISVSTDQATGLVTFSVKTEWADLSGQIALTILELVNKFNLKTRQSQATAERRFVEERLREVEIDLRNAEDAQQDFLQKNRQWQSSPELGFIHDRLQRKVTMRQQIFTTLTQVYEQARIDEVRDTPVITIIERVETPVLPDRRRLKLKAFISLIVGAMIGIFVALGREYLIRGHQQGFNEFSEFENLKKETLQDIRKPWRLLVR